jgi:hypothetical protein
MRRNLGAIACTLLVAGCVRHELAWSDPVVAPDGNDGFTVACYRADLCYRIAGEDCPEGYTILAENGEQRSSGSLIGAQGFASGHYSSEKLTTLLIECGREEPRAARPAPPAPASPVAPGDVEPRAPPSPPAAMGDGGVSIVTKAPF